MLNVGIQRIEQGPGWTLLLVLHACLTCRAKTESHDHGKAAVLPDVWY